jgi:hypothetical protein
MTVFLRWGVFGIIAVAALLYAYNASKDLARIHQSTSAPVVGQEDSTADEVETAESEATAGIETASVAEVEPQMPEDCEQERLVAERALKYRRDGEPLDRLLRIDVIAFQADDQRRQRLETVARQWYEREGRDPNAAALRGEVLRDCRKVTRAP